MKKSNFFSELIKPALVLALIALIVSGALVTVYNLTKKPDGYIDPEIVTRAGEMLGETAEPLRSDLTPYAPYHVEAVFKGQSGAAVIYLWSKGYGGEIKTLVGIDADGKVLNVQITDMMETAGLGDRTQEPEFTNQYIGKSGTIEVVKTGAAENQIDAISGATISSRAVTLSVNNALEVFHQLQSEVTDRA